MTQDRDSVGGAPTAAVFLDRDGGIIEDRGPSDHRPQAVPFAETVRVLRRLQERFLLFIATDQSGIGEGILCHAEMDEVNAHIVQNLARAGIMVSGVHVCPRRRAEGRACIKPTRTSWSRLQQGTGWAYVGPTPSAISRTMFEFGRSVGATDVHVLTGHGIRHEHQLPEGTQVTHGIAQVVDWILRRRRLRG